MLRAIYLPIDNLHDVEPPFVPQLKSDIDTTYFDHFSDVTMEEPAREPCVAGA